MKNKQPIIYIARDEKQHQSFAVESGTHFIVHPGKNLNDILSLCSLHTVAAIVVTYDAITISGFDRFLEVMDTVNSIPLIVSVSFSQPQQMLELARLQKALVYLNGEASQQEKESAILSAIDEKKHQKACEEDMIGLQTKIIALERELSVAYDTARIKSAFIENLSHEIRTPLNAIIGFSQLIQNRDLPTRQLDTYHDLIEKGVNELFALLEDIMLMSKIDNHELELREKPTEIKEFFTLFYNEIKYNPTYRSKERVDILVPQSFTDNICFYTDSRKLKDILNRLVHNAYKFTEEGNIEIGYSFSQHEDQQLLHFFVKDSGKGIPEEQLNMIFDRFNKLETKNEMLYRGLGIGLTISQALARIIHAKITVESEISKGSTFMVSIPFKPCTRN